MKNIRTAYSIYIAALALLTSAPSLAGVIHHGGVFSVEGSPVDSNTADFTYTADFTNWSGNLNFIFVIDFSIGGPNVASIDSFSTTAGGTWTAGTGASAAPGCVGGATVFACSSTSGANQSTSGIVTWNFRITFDGPVSASSWTDSNNHIGAFFCNAPCSGPPNAGLGLSQETSFTTTTVVPEPGLLSLLSVGLLATGLGWRRRSA